MIRAALAVLAGLALAALVVALYYALPGPAPEPEREAWHPDPRSLVSR